MELRGTFYLALFKEGNKEISRLGYKRLPIEFNCSKDPLIIEFGPVPKNWGKISYLGIMDAPTGGNCLVKIFFHNVEAGDKINCSSCFKFEINS